MSIGDMILNLPIPVLNHWGYWIIFLATMLEAMPFGFIVPGHIIVIIGGFLAKIGVFKLYEVILIASLGAVIGDIINYFIGKTYGYDFIKKYGKYFFLKKENYDKTKKLMNKHTGKTVIIGRFNPITRSFAPFIAGSTNVSFSKFIIYNIIGGVAWVFSAVFIGFIFGKSYEVATKYVGDILLGAIILSIIIVYLYRFIDKRKHIFSKFHLYALFLNIFSLYMFSKMIEDIIDNEFVTRLDVWINIHMVTLWNPSLNSFMISITNLVSPTNLTFLSITLLIVLLTKKKWYYSLLLLFSLLGGLLFELLIKLLIHRPRPENALINVAGYSFPSGHSTMAIIFFSLLIYSFKDDIKNKMLRYNFIASNISLFVIIGFSRIYLNVHWFSDVVAGFSLGLFWLTLLILVFKVIMSLLKKVGNIIKTYFLQFLRAFTK